jgi:hypothetical protein
VECHRRCRPAPDAPRGADTVLAMLPLTRSVFWGPMALAIMGGLTIATVLTIFFVPALYAAWFKVRRHQLPGLLGRLRSRLWERWPLRLQYCLATATTEQDQPSDELLGWLANALEAQARRGSLRSDLSAKALAQIVLALLVGEVAQRFVSHEATLSADPAFIDGVVRLLSAS